MPKKPRKPLRPSAAARAALRPPPSVEILDIAFHRASLATPKGSTKSERDRRRAQLKIVRSGATVSRQIQSIVRSFHRPPLTDLELALLATRFRPGSFERAMARLQRALVRIRGLQRESERALPSAGTPEEIGTEVRRFYGRLSSHVREIDPDLRQLGEMRGFLRARPKLSPNVPTLAVAGFPNVGKSALVAQLSTARPRVAPFPFTTLAIEVGHADLGFDRWQVLDTPGVLGRAGRANLAEAEASTAVDRGAQVVLFVIDPTESCGYTVADQEKLLARWRRELEGRPIIVVESKSDLRPKSRSDRLQISTVTGEGIDALRTAIRAATPVMAPAPPVEEEPVFEMTEEERSSDRMHRRRKPRHSDATIEPGAPE
ncbi:MAG: GTPase [Thermoplasmata archaeon]